MASNILVSAKVLLSGGLDSTCLLKYCLSRGFQTTALFVDYGQAAAERERQAAREVSSWMEVKLDEIELSRCCESLGSGEIRSRNLLLISIAAHNTVTGCCLIGIGIHSGTPYSDCSVEFVETADQALQISTKGQLELFAPFLKWTKEEILAYGKKEGVPVERTYSCEGGNSPCGRCDSCKDRERFNVGS